VRRILMPGGALKEVLKEVRLVREKVERLEELVEERLIGLEEPLEDEIKAIKEYMRAKEKGSVELIPVEDVEKEK
jgi:hypothetical protein